MTYVYIIEADKYIKTAKSLIIKSEWGSSYPTQISDLDKNELKNLNNIYAYQNKNTQENSNIADHVLNTLKFLRDNNLSQTSSIKVHFITKNSYKLLSTQETSLKFNFGVNVEIFKYDNDVINQVLLSGGNEADNEEVPLSGQEAGSLAKFVIASYMTNGADNCVIL